MSSMPGDVVGLDVGLQPDPFVRDDALVDVNDLLGQGDLVLSVVRSPPE